MKRISTSHFGPSRRVLCTLLFAAALAATIGAVASSRAVSPSGSHDQSAAMSKIAPWVSAHTGNGQQAEFLVVLADQADLHAASALRTKQEKGRYVRDTLWNKAKATQAPVLQWLREHKVEYRSYYIVNMIWVKGTADIALQLAARSDVARVEGNPQIRNCPNPLPHVDAPAQTDSPATIEQGIAYSHAPDVWALGFTGQGIVVGDGDTGFNWQHNAIKPHYRGWDGTTADHDYNWHDSIHSGGGLCGADSPQPCDDNGHGTHTMGTAIGDDGAGNQIGMAPGAQCIGCRNMNQGVGSPATYMECWEFFLAPYPVGGNSGEGDPTKAPDMTTNSWECPSSEGCSAGTLQAAVEAQRAAGIETVVAAQNSGPSCSTVVNPPGIYDAAYSIGALNNGTDTIATFSSRGPVTADGSNRLKPDLSAPGTNVRSSYGIGGNNAYAILSGTSMATPHVAGAVALLWSAHPELRTDLDATEAALNTSATHILSSTCDGGGTPVSPNNTFGYGRMDALAAVQQQPQFSLTAAVSRQTHGTAGIFDVPLPLSGEPGVECRSSKGKYTLVFTFNSDVMDGGAAVTSGTGSVQGRPNFSGSTMTVNLAGVDDVQQITVTLHNVTSTTSEVLPDTLVSANILVGDVTGDKTVDQLDLSQTKREKGMTVTADNFRDDVKVSGTITAADVRVVRSDLGHTLP